MWIQREGSQTTAAFLSTVNKFFFTCAFRPPPSFQLRTEDEQRGDRLTWRTDVSVCFAAKLYNLSSASVLYDRYATQTEEAGFCLCCKFIWQKHNKWMSLDLSMIVLFIEFKSDKIISLIRCVTILDPVWFFHLNMSSLFLRALATSIYSQIVSSVI